MQYSIENDILRLTVDSHGAEPVSVIHKPTGAELLWQAEDVYKRQVLKPVIYLPAPSETPRMTGEFISCAVSRMLLVHSRLLMLN